MAFAHFEGYNSPLSENLNMLQREDMTKMHNVLYTENPVDNYTSVIFRKYPPISN